jgi:hypothetical protein
MRPQLALYSGDTLELNKPISLPEENVDFWAALNQPKKVVHYNARILSISPSVRLDPGDALLLLLKQVPGKTFLERALFSDLPLWRDKPRQQHNGWRLAVLRNQHVRDKDKNKLDMLVTMENLNVHPGAGDHLRQTAHGFQWFQLKADGNPQRGLRWGSDWFYPAPAWRLEVGKWQDTGKDKLVPPELDTWWIEDPYPKLHRGLSHNDFKEKGKYRDHDIGGVKDVKVIIESVGIEDRQVGPKGEKASCLIVRLRHDRHKPIWVELRTPNAEARQHLFYDDACKVTAIFWPVTQGEFESGFRLDLTSIEAFKTDAMHFPHTLFKPRLGIPDYSSGPSPQKKSGS